MFGPGCWTSDVDRATMRVGCGVSVTTVVRFAGVLILGLSGCHHRAPTLSEVGPDEECEGQRLLEFTNRLAVPVEVGWIPEEQLAGDPSLMSPEWLGVVGMETMHYELSGPGRVIFRTADPSAVREERHHVSHRVLCRSP